MKLIINDKKNNYYKKSINLKLSLFMKTNIQILIFLIFLDIAINSQIALKIQGGGEISFLNDDFYTEPSEVLVNSQLKSSCKKKCTLGSGINTVIIKFNTQINSCLNMFKEMSNIIEIDLSQFDASKVTTMENMFMDCSNLKKVTLGNIDTSSVKDMKLLFLRCTKLESIDLANLDTRSVTTMSDMFSHCESLTSIDLSKINTANVENMYDMFCQCTKLSSLDLTKFDTRKVQNMRGMFYYCTNLKYLDLSSFSTTSINNVGYMFYRNEALIYLNLGQFRVTSETNRYRIFTNAASYLKICVTDSTSKNLFETQESRTVDCSDICFTNSNSKIDLIGHQCINHCYETSNKYEYSNDKFCYNNCKSGTYPKENDYLCLTENPEGYYLDYSAFKYKKCYIKCKSCSEAGDATNNNCNECTTTYPYIVIKSGNKNCYTACPSSHSKLISAKNECVNKCNDDATYQYELDNECYIACPNGKYPKENEYLCLREKPEGYYLDYTAYKYKKCYTKCKSCSEAGDANNNNCNECKSDYPYILIKGNYKNCNSDCPSGTYTKENELICLEQKPEGYYSKSDNFAPRKFFSFPSPFC